MWKVTEVRRGEPRSLASAAASVRQRCSSCFEMRGTRVFFPRIVRMFLVWHASHTSGKAQGREYLNRGWHKCRVVVEESSVMSENQPIIWVDTGGLEKQTLQNT